MAAPAVGLVTNGGFLFLEVPKDIDWNAASHDTNAASPNRSPAVLSGDQFSGDVATFLY